MNYVVTPHGLILFITAALSLIVGVTAWQRRQSLTGKILTLLMVCIAIYAFSSAIQAGTSTLNTNVIWAKISYLGYVWLTPLCLFFVLAYTNNLKWNNPPLFIVMGTIPLLTLILVWTNEFHGLIWSGFALGDKRLNIWIFDHGPWFWIFVVFQISIYCLTLAILIKDLQYKKPPYRQQTITILIATLLPAIAGILYSLKISPVPGLDWMPVFAFFSGLVFSWSFYHYRLLDLVPLARDVLVEQMLDGVIVLDDQQRIIDINPSARKMIKLGDTIKIGDSFAAAMPEIYATLTRTQAVNNTQTLAFRATHEGLRYMDVRFTIIDGKNIASKCSLVLLRDITRRKAIEDSLNKANQELEKRLEEIEKLQAKLREESIRDPLTNLYNRRYLEDTLLREFAHANRDKFSVCLIMMDIDHFKKVNDSYGHNIGDTVLQQLSQSLVTNFRMEDIICRFGGEEFTIVMPGTTRETALARTETFRKILEETVMPIDDNRIQITISAGVAVYPEDGSTVDDVIKVADQALYQAKSSGRNRVVAGHPAA